MANRAKIPFVAIVCSPGMGHLIPCLQLANCLATVHNLSITLLINSTDPSSREYLSLLKTLPDSVNAFTLPLPSPDSFPENTDPLTQVFLTTRLNLPQIQLQLKDLQSTGRLSALVTDMFSFYATEAGLQLGIPCYRFIPCSCMTLSLCLHMPELDKSISGNLKDLGEPIRLPGCVPIYGTDLVEPVQLRSDAVYPTFLQQCKNLFNMKGILVNSFEELEPDTIKALRNNAQEGWPPVYAIGPLIRPIEFELGVEKNESLAWLDLQPNTSVVYISFGSWCTLEPEQLTELAFGLEQSGHRFLWIIKSLDVLPEGLLERTKEVGRIITTWAPQMSILKHKSVAAFMTHCGWNSVLEGVTNGVPLIAFAKFADQMMNATLLTGDAKVSLRLKESESGLISRDEISRVVKCLMEEKEGKLLRERAALLRDLTMGALLKNGPSHHAMTEVVEEWKKNIQHNDILSKSKSKL